MTMNDQLTEHDQTELLARAQDAWERAPQNTMRAVFEWRGKNYVGRAQCDLRSHGQTHPLIPAVQARHRDGLRRQESGCGAAAPHAGIARMADRISAERGGLCGVNLARRHSAKNGGRKRWLQAGLWGSCL